MKCRSLDALRSLGMTQYELGSESTDSDPTDSDPTDSDPVSGGHGFTTTSKPAVRMLSRMRSWTHTR
jgi:hypothetical protein